MIRNSHPDVSSDVRALSLAQRAADAALVAGLAVGDEAAAIALVRRFQSSVYGLALSITRDPGLAEDVSQEVFVRAWRAASNYDSRKASVLTWLLAITRNAAIDVVRMRRPVPVDDELLDAVLIDVGSPSTEDEAVRGLERARAVVLAVIGGCTAAEISRRESIPLGTAKSRIRIGLEKLRQIWEEDRHE